jgi:hypothetical protein
MNPIIIIASFIFFLCILFKKLTYWLVLLTTLITIYTIGRFYYLYIRLPKKRRARYDQYENIIQFDRKSIVSGDRRKLLKSAEEYNDELFFIADLLNEVPRLDMIHLNLGKPLLTSVLVLTNPALLRDLNQMLPSNVISHESLEKDFGLSCNESFIYGTEMADEDLVLSSNIKSFPFKERRAYLNKKIVFINRHQN